MVSKRGEANMALLYDHNPVEEDTSGTNSPTPTPLRRSSRQLQRHGEFEGLRPRGNPQKPSRGLKSNGRPEGTEKVVTGILSTNIKHGQLENKAGVNMALESLRKMEDDFRDTVKRQKQVVDESIVSPATAEENAFFPRTEERTGPDTLPPKVEKKGLGQMASIIKKEQKGEALPAPTTAEDPEDGDQDGVPEENDTSMVKEQGARPPPVNSDYLPLPWKGRLGYACLNTYLRQANTPVFSSRTCRIASILDHRHPLQDPSQPEHSTKNRPDKSQPADVARGQKYVESLGLANAHDVAKMIRWNDKYGIKFMRLSSEMFPFASHQEYGYKLEPFAAETLAEAGKVIAELGHRVTTHPGQFTQLGSPRREVIENAVRDLDYHEEMLSLLKLPEQQNKDAVMIIHMGGTYGDKQAALDRFKENYAKLSPGVKARLVLENDDVSWSVHDLLPVCEELNIPFVLDFHHHNILFDADKIREGTEDIIRLFPRIKATWDLKGITQKMHYSEPCPGAVTPRQRRKHSPRVATLPPCAPDMDLMIEAKDKEQAVFALMRAFKLPGWDRFNDIVPYEREDENRPPPPAAKKAKKKKQPRKRKGGPDNGENEDEATEAGEFAEGSQQELKLPPTIAEEDIGMGGPNNRVFWPEGLEEWLRPRKREVKKKAAAATTTTAADKAEQEDGAEAEEDSKVSAASTPAPKTKKAASAPGEKRKRRKKDEPKDDDEYQD